MAQETEQIKFWRETFGKDYTHRNTVTVEGIDEYYCQTWGISRTELNREFLKDIQKDGNILEVGCNIGQQLRHLQPLGFENLYGIEIQTSAVEKAKAVTQNINVICGSAFDIPFRDRWMDLVFTSGVLIHIHPDDIEKAVHEIYRCTKKYIWGFEYYAPELTEIDYRGHKNVLWKRDFCKLYTDLYPDLKIIRERKVKYLENENVDQMFLLEKVK